MYLAELKLWNFRKFGTLESCSTIIFAKPCLEVEFNPKLNVLIGENDFGKTAIIDAIKQLYGLYFFLHITRIIHILVA